MRSSKLICFLLLLFSLSLLWGEKVVYHDDLIEVVADKRDAVLAQQIMGHLPSLIGRFQMEIGVYPKFKAKIYLSHNQKDFQNIAATFGGITEHSNAFYSRRDSVIYIKSFLEIGNAESFYQILHHEYIHAFIDYHLHNVPLWFHEGMAVHFSKQFSTNMVYSLGVDYLLKKMPHISTMERNYPTDSGSLPTFYAKSAMAVKYLHEQDSPALSLMFRTDKSFNRAFNQSFGKSLEMFYYDFEQDFQKKIILNVVYSLGTMLGLIFPVIFIWGWIRRSLIKKKRDKSAPEEDDNNDEDVIITL